MSMHWHTYSTPQLAAEACCRRTLSYLEQVLAGQNEATMAISGGSTPKLLFGEMAKSGFAWDRVHFYWVDERLVPPTDPESNYRLAEECFLQPAHVPHRNVHRIHGELRPAAAAKNYVIEVEESCNLAPGELPHFDVVHLGMGADGHTASLFPGEPLILNRDSIAAAVYVEKFAKWRVSLLPGVLLNAKHIVMLVAGDDKAEVLRNVIESKYDPMTYPAQLIAHHGRNVTWFVDAKAAALANV